MRAPLPLGVLQTRFLARVTASPRERDEALAGVALGDERLDAEARLEIYREAYSSRLVSVVRDDFPVVAAVLGDERFEALALAYAQAHPSRGPNLTRFAANFPGFVGSRAAEFVGELARLEWAIVEVIHARTEPRLTREGLMSASAQAGAALRLRPRATLRLVVAEHRVNELFQGYQDDGATDAPRPQPEATAVHRDGLTVWRTPVSVALAPVLRALMGGATLGEALAEAAPAPSAQEISSTFAEWVSSGFFRELEDRV